MFCKITTFYIYLEVGIAVRLNKVLKVLKEEF